MHKKTLPKVRYGLKDSCMEQMFVFQLGLYTFFTPNILNNNNQRGPNCCKTSFRNDKSDIIEHEEIFAFLFFITSASDIE